MHRVSLLILLSLEALSGGDRLSSYQAVESHMGTLMRITLYASDPETAASAFRAAFDRIHQLDEILSDYQPNSELNAICRIAVHHNVQVSADLFQVLAASQQISAESGGAFDITLAPVIRLWRIARSRHELPSPEALREAAGRCGYRKLHLDPRQRSVSFDQPDMQLDVGGIAKGYAADQALAVLSRLGIRSALVAASGDLAFSDAPPGQPGWKIGLSSPGQVLYLSNAAVSTSGDTQQHLEQGGKRYSHIIDPATNIGLTTGISVTVVSAHGIDADALSTAVSVLGAKRAQALLEKHSGTCFSLSPATLKSLPRSNHESPTLFTNRRGSCVLAVIRSPGHEAQYP